MVSYVFEIFATSPEGKNFWLQAQYLAVACIPTASLVFVLAFTQQLFRVKQPRFWLSFLEPLFGILLIFTNSYHHLVWTDEMYVTVGGYTFTETVNGPWSWFHLAFAVCIAAADGAFIRQHAPQTPRAYRFQSLIIIMSIGLIGIGVVLDLLSLPVFQGMKFTPISILLAALSLAAAISFHRMRDILPLVRDAILENMSDGIILLDQDNKIIDCNQSASNLLGKKLAEVTNTPIEVAWPDWPGINALPRDKGEVVKELVLSTRTEQRNYDLQISGILDDPIPRQSKKLSGAEHLYRVRVGEYRIVFSVETTHMQVVIQYVRHRRDVYRQM